MNNLAEGVSPRKQLAFLAPPAPFAAASHGGKSVIAPEAYRRYDGFADVAAAIDAQAVANAYRVLHPALEAAYRALGYPDGVLDRVTARALGRILAAPVEDGEVAVESQGGGYAFADPKLERLDAVDKHLLRMGPRNTRLIQAKCREILQALGLTVEVARQKR